MILFLLLPPDAAQVEQILSETCCEDENHRQDNSSSHHRALLLSHGRNSDGLFWAEVNPSSHRLVWPLILLQNVQNAPKYKTGCQDDLFQGILGLLSALHMNTSGRQFFQVDLKTHFLLKQVQLDDDFQPWQWETLRELQSNRFLYSRSVTTLSATWWTC